MRSWHLMLIQRAPVRLLRSWNLTAATLATRGLVMVPLPITHPRHETTLHRGIAQASPRPHMKPPPRASGNCHDSTRSNPRLKSRYRVWTAVVAAVDAVSNATATKNATDAAKGVNAVAVAPTARPLPATHRSAASNRALKIRTRRNGRGVSRTSLRIRPARSKREENMRQKAWEK